jgi:spore coat polysaccharide biosynthesis protein SpsF
MIDAPALIQARMTSTRLPGKSLLPLGNDLVLGQVIRRASAFSTSVAVLTSADPSDDPIARFCARRGVPCIRGPLEDVLGRYLLALTDSRIPASPWLWRITADCPLLSPQLAHLCAAVAESGAGDRLDFIGVDQGTAASGISAELIRRDALTVCGAEAKARREREHVTLFMYEHPELFSCLRIAPPAELAHPEVRLTLDTRTDYVRLAALFAGNPELDAGAAIAAIAGPPRGAVL